MDQDPVELLAPLVLQAPPGQVESVTGDIASILALSSHDAPRAFEARLPSLLAQHNEEQLIVADVSAGAPGAKEAGQLIISKEARVGQEQRYRYPPAGITVAIDHRTLKCSDVRPLKPNAVAEPLRSALQRALDAYVRDHYPDGAASVIALPLGDVVKPAPPTHAAAPEEAAKEKEESKPATEDAEGDAAIADATEKDEATPAPTEAAEAPEAASKQDDDSEMKPPTSEVAKLAVAEKEVVEEDESEVQGETSLVMHVVGNKYNPANFWAGRWRSTYTYTPSSSGVVQATNRILVHYYENGNVQLRHSRSVELTLPSSSSGSGDEAALAQSIVKAIERQENAYQVELGTTFETLGGEAFKAMRRALPLTKQKMNWDKISTYKLSSEFAQ